MLISWWLLAKIFSFGGTWLWFLLLPSSDIGVFVFCCNFLGFDAGFRWRRGLLLGGVDLSAHVALLVVGLLMWLLVLVLSSSALALSLC